MDCAGVPRTLTGGFIMDSVFNLTKQSWKGEPWILAIRNAPDGPRALTGRFAMNSLFILLRYKLREPRAPTRLLPWGFALDSALISLRN